MQSRNSKIICINKYIKEDLLLEEGGNVIVLENGFDEDIFTRKNKGNKVKIVYSGNLQRFGKTRGVGIAHVGEVWKKYGNYGGTW